MYLDVCMYLVVGHELTFEASTLVVTSVLSIIINNIPGMNMFMCSEIVSFM